MNHSRHFNLFENQMTDLTTLTPQQRPDPKCITYNPLVIEISEALLFVALGTECFWRSNIQQLTAYLYSIRQDSAELEETLCAQNTSAYTISINA